MFSDLQVVGSYNEATINWQSNYPGLDDKVQLWPLASHEDVVEIRNPLLDKFENPSMVLSILNILTNEGISHKSDQEVLIGTLQSAGFEVPEEGDEIFEVFNQDLQFLRSIELLPLAHQVFFEGLSADTEYGYEVISISFSGYPAEPIIGNFRTQMAPIVFDPHVVSIYNEATTVSYTHLPLPPSDLV